MTQRPWTYQERKIRQGRRLEQIARTDQFVDRSTRTPAAGPTSYPIKVRDPETADIVEKALRERGLAP